MNITYGAGRSTLLTLGLLGMMMSLGCGRTTANEPGPVATNQSGTETQSVASQGATLPAEARAVLEQEMAKRFLRLENGDRVTRIDVHGAYSINGTENHTGGDLVAEGWTHGFRFHRLGYKATRRPIGVAEKLDGIEECFDIVFTASAVAKISRLDRGVEDTDLNQEKVAQSWFRNIKTETLDFPVLTVLNRHGEWKIVRGDYLHWFTSDFHPSDVKDLNQ